MPGSRFLRGVGFFLLTVLAVTLARRIAASAGFSLGAIGILLLVSPFLYWAVRKPKAPLSDEDRLESMVANAKLSPATRQEAQQRLDALRAGRS
jgi:hypothetical protein